MKLEINYKRKKKPIKKQNVEAKQSDNKQPLDQ